jgi:Coenzyme PQQ synthesis protein D (PqqD)
MKNSAMLPQARTKDLVIRELDDETLVYDLVSDKAHCLNQSAALVWKSCDGKTTAQEAVQAVQSALGAPVDADVIWLAVNQLERFHLVESDAKTPAVSRRALVLKYAPAALALPVIMSITAPTPAQNGSCARTCVYNSDCLPGDFCSNGCCFAG